MQMELNNTKRLRKRFEQVKLYPANGNFVLIDLGIEAGTIFSYLEKKWLYYAFWRGAWFSNCCSNYDRKRRGK